MKRRMVIVLLAGCLSVGLVYPLISNAGVNLNVTVLLPELGIAVPPAMVVIPGSYAYFAPDVEAELFFYRGYWYRPYRGEWYFSAEYNGAWGRVAIGNVPPPLINLPPDYRNVPPGYERMPYHMVKRNWRHWEEERHWDSYEGRGRYARPHSGHGMGMGHMGH